MPVMPFQEAGNRMEPPVSEPRAPKQRPAETPTPEPLLDPAGAWSVFQGVTGLGAVAGRAHHGKLAHGELAEHGSTGIAEAFGDGGVGVWDAVIEAQAAVGRADALCVAEVFEGYGDAMEGAAGVAICELTVGVFGLLEGEVGGGG